MNAGGTLRARWQALPLREQRLVLAAGVLVALALTWWLALAPALSTLKVAAAQRPLLDAQLQQMHRLQAQAKALQALPVLDAQAMRSALELSLKPLDAGAQMTQQGDRVTVTLKSVPAQALAQWLSAARQNAHAVPAEVHLKRNVAGAWDGSVVFKAGTP